MAEETSRTTPNISQATYSETTYVDADWEVIGIVQDVFEFEPLMMEAVAEERAIVDPMFADYGGFGVAEGKRRWHLPEGVRAQTAAAVEHSQTAAGATDVTLAEEELNRHLEEMLQKGREEGKEAALEEMRGRQAELEQRLNVILQDLMGQLRNGLARVEKEAVNLALSISQKIVGHAVEVNPEYITVLVTEALALAGGATVKRVRLSPQDMEFFEVLGMKGKFADSDSEWEFEPDPTIRSGCVVETTSGSIDVQLEQAWARIQENVLKAIR